MRLVKPTELTELIPATFQPATFIAGGYLAHSDKANDLDLWVLAPGLAGNTVLKIQSHLYDLGVDVVTPVVGESEEYSQLPSAFSVAGTVYLDEDNDGDDTKVQIIVTNHKTIQELLASFDITTHQLGLALLDYSSYGGLLGHEALGMIFGPGWTPIDQQPRVILWDRPTATLKRLRRISERYGFEPNAADVMKLLAMGAVEPRTEQDELDELFGNPFAPAA